MGLNSAYEDVRLFHKTFNHPAPDTPTIQPWERREKRAAWINSECEELLEAETIVDQADAYLDIIYFALGGLVELCVKPANLFAIVQKANMAKLFEDGKPRFHPDGKVRKPPLWEPPERELELEVAHQVAQGRAS